MKITRSPTVSFMITNITRKEYDAVIRKERSKSAPGNNGMSYVVHKVCPGILGNSWSIINMPTYEHGHYPDNFPLFEGVHILQTDGELSQ